MRKTLIIALLAFLSSSMSAQKGSVSPRNNQALNLLRAQELTKNIYQYYGVKGEDLLRENYPMDKQYKASYLASEDEGDSKKWAYLWPYSGMFSGLNALYSATGQEQYYAMLKSEVKGLSQYLDTTRLPFAYASYINTSAPSDRFYDDNIWLGIDFVILSERKEKQENLQQAKLIWDFILSGQDEKLGGGIYWCEQKRASKNTCSNAPASVLALKLFEATGDSSYLQAGKELYFWTKEHLQDPSDGLYFDNESLNGNISKAKYSYNSGQMIEASALLYKITGDKEFLFAAQYVAASAMKYFSTPFIDQKTGEKMDLIKPGNTWFMAVMMRGLVALYHQDHNPAMLLVFQKNLDYAWEHNRSKEGFFSEKWQGDPQCKKYWLLNQAAMLEMYATMPNL